MRKHGLHALGAGFEAVKTKKRIEPYQSPAGSMKPVDLEGERIIAIAFKAIGYQKHHRALREHTARPLSVERT